LTEANLDKHDEAIEHLELFLASNPKSEILIKKATQYIGKFKFAATATSNPVPFKPKSVSDNINSANAEYLPALTADGETMIFTRRVRGQEDFYVSSKKDGKWNLGIPLLDINDPVNNEGAQSISADGKFLVFTACNRRDGYGSCDLYYSEIRNGKWTPPANIGAPINTRGWESQPTISGNGNILMYASNRQGGKGGYDIWMSKRKPNGSWGKPENLGANINTAAQEQTPFLHPDMQTLYFMSDGHPGMGGTDMFFARKQKDGTWGKPENLGYPINTEGHEGALIVSLDGKTAYFATDRKYDAFTGESILKNTATGKETDIYYFDLYEAARPQAITYVKATVSDAETNKKLIANVEIVDLAMQKTFTTSITDMDGEFLICMPVGANYALNVNKEKYLFHSENFALNQSATLEKPYVMNIALQPIKEVATTSPSKPTTSSEVPPKSKPIILKNVFFETGSAELQNVSVTELNRLKTLLVENENLKIQINGHTDNVGTEDANKSLSTNRAKSVYDWLIQNGINSNRLQYEGFGESVPIDTNDTNEGKQNNRRTEFVVL